jgi:hypothetical protein
MIHDIARSRIIRTIDSIISMQKTRLWGQPGFEVFGKRV